MANLITQKEYARRRHVTPQYIAKLVREGRIPLVQGKVDPKKADASWSRDKSGSHQARKKSSRAAATVSSGRPPRGSASHNLTEARAQKAYYEGLAAKLDYEEKLKTLLPRAEVIEAEQRKNANIRTQLRRIPRSVAQALATTTTPAECEQILLNAIDAFLISLAVDPLGFDADTKAEPVPAAEPEVRTSAEAAPKNVLDTAERDAVPC